MTKLMASLLACLIAVALASPAEAKPRQYRSYETGQIVAHPAGCPRRAFCGCGTCVRVGISLAKCKRMGLFLARNWLHKFPRATCSYGMAAARPGHVMAILSCNGNNMATVYDPNSGGHRTRIHTRSLSGYRVVDPHGSRVASR